MIVKVNNHTIVVAEKKGIGGSSSGPLEAGRRELCDFGGSEIA